MMVGIVAMVAMVAMEDPIFGSFEYLGGKSPNIIEDVEAPKMCEH